MTWTKKVEPVTVWDHTKPQVGGWFSYPWFDSEWFSDPAVITWTKKTSPNTTWTKE